MPKTTLRTANAKHEAVYQDITAVLRKHEASLSAVEILAIVSNMVGKLVALQDQRTMSASAAMQIVASNIEEGNAQALAEVRNTRGSA